VVREGSGLGRFILLASQFAALSRTSCGFNMSLILPALREFQPTTEGHTKLVVLCLCSYTSRVTKASIPMINPKPTALRRVIEKREPKLVEILDCRNGIDDDDDDDIQVGRQSIPP